jgi:hypothetical protein
VKDALRERHFVENSELKQSLCDALPSRSREFYKNGMQHLIVGRSLLKMTESL